MTKIIEARAVSKRFRQHRRFPGFRGAIKTLFTAEYTEVAAVTDVSFAISPGEAVGYLGPNGAGKSTMIKMLTGILVPSSGAVSVLDRTPHRERMTNAREIGAVCRAEPALRRAVRTIVASSRACAKRGLLLIYRRDDLASGGSRVSVPMGSCRRLDTSAGRRRVDVPVRHEGRQ